MKIGCLKPGVLIGVIVTVASSCMPALGTQKKSLTVGDQITAGSRSARAFAPRPVERPHVNLR